MRNATAAADHRPLIRDLLLPGIVAVELTLGLGDVADLVWEDETLQADAPVWVLKLKIADEGREIVWTILSEAEIEGGFYKDQFVPRVNAAFDEFLRAGGVTGGRAYLDIRGPRHPPGAAEEEVLT